MLNSNIHRAYNNEFGQTFSSMLMDGLSEDYAEKINIMMQAALDGAGPEVTDEDLYPGMYPLPDEAKV